MQDLNHLPVMPKFDHSVSLLCWAYNEEDSIEGYLNRAANLMESVADDYEIVLIDDGSTDKTYQIAENYQKNNPRLKIFRNGKNLNVGFSCKRAIKEATKEFLFWQTIDWCYELSDVRKFLEYLKSYDIVQCVRQKPGLRRFFNAKYMASRSDNIKKAVVSVINYTIIRLLFRVPVSDFQNVTFYSTKWIQSVEFEADSSFLNPEGLIKSYWHGKTIKEVPINFIPRKEGCAKGTKLKAIIKSIRDIFTLWFKWVVLGKRGKIIKGKVYKIGESA